MEQQREVLKFTHDILKLNTMNFVRVCSTYGVNVDTCLIYVVGVRGEQGRMGSISQRNGERRQPAAAVAVAVV